MIEILEKEWGVRDILKFYRFNQSFEKEGRSNIELFFHCCLTALEMAHGGTPIWRAGSANRLECTKKRISLQDADVPPHLRVLARNVLPHCAHDTKLPRMQKSIPN